LIYQNSDRQTAEVGLTQLNFTGNMAVALRRSY
jgi:hypothetical protein